MRPGANTTVTTLPGGQALNAGPGPRWKHPWFTTAGWTGREWVATIKPGTVNGVAPGYRTWARQQAQFGNSGVSPLDGHRYFSASVFSQQPTDDTLRPIDLPLYLQPRIELRLRAVGLDGAPEEIVPAYFLARGAVPALTTEELTAALEGGEIAPPPRAARRLRAADLILHQPRAGLTISITIQPDFNGISNVTQRLEVRTPSPGDALRVFSGRYLPPGEIDPLAGVYEEPNHDELHLATVWLLSPPGAEGEPDASWQPFVQHFVFWPLSYQAPPPFRPRELSSGALSVPLLGGLAQPVVNFFTAAAGDAADMALNWIQAASNRGRWWTATGGGSDAEFPVEPAAPVKVTGLSRAARIQADLEARRAAQFRTLQAQVLNPRFPYRAISFSK